MTDKAHEVLTSIEIDAALAFFTYSMTMETRARLMNEYPAIYNKLMGKQIVEVRLSDGNTLIRDYYRKDK